jgi:histidinol-phosphate aminotransferase
VRAAAGARALLERGLGVGLLDYYKQFEGMSEEEVNAGLREEAAERKRKALTRLDTLDLSHTTWPELPHPRIVNAITFVARRGLQRYPHLKVTELRDALAERHGVEPAHLILGNGAGELLAASTRAAIEPGQHLLTPWPSYPLFPIMARRAHGRAVSVSGGVDELLDRSHHEPDVRVIAIASPNDPTGELVPIGEVQRLLDGLPPDVVVLLDEALVDFVDAQPREASLQLLAHYPRLIVFRSFSKAWGLAGLRIGYAIGGPGSAELLAELEPDLGVSEVSQAGAYEALHSCVDLIEKRVQTILEERPYVTAGLRERGFDVADSQANFLWAAHPELDGDELAARLEQAGILVAPGAALGEPQHARIALRSRRASDRLLHAVDKSL